MQLVPEDIQHSAWFRVSGRCLIAALIIVIMVARGGKAVKGIKKDLIRCLFYSQIKPFNL